MPFAFPMPAGQLPKEQPQADDPNEKRRKAFFDKHKDAIMADEEEIKVHEG